MHPVSQKICWKHNVYIANTLKYLKANEEYYNEALERAGFSEKIEYMAQEKGQECENMDKGIRNRINSQPLSKHHMEKRDTRYF